MEPIEDVKTGRREIRRLRAAELMRRAKVGGKLLAVIVSAAVPAVVTGLNAYQASKDKSEAGYQATIHKVAEMESRLLRLEEGARLRQLAEAHQAAAAVAAPARRPGSRSAHHQPAPPLPPAPIAVQVTAHPKPLPSDLDQAERQLLKAMNPAPPAAPPPRSVDAAP